MVIAAGALTLLLGAAACSSDDPEPHVAPPSSSPPTTTPASSPTAPTMPEPANDHTPHGAEAFVRYFIAVLNFAQRTGDTSALNDVSTEACAGCRGYVQAIDRAYRTGGRVEGGTISIGKLRSLPKDYGADWGGFATGSATAQDIYDGNGGKKSYPGGDISLYAYVKWQAGGWAMQWIRTPA